MKIKYQIIPSNDLPFTIKEKINNHIFTFNEKQYKLIEFMNPNLIEELSKHKFTVNFESIELIQTDNSYLDTVNLLLTDKDLAEACVRLFINDYRAYTWFLGNNYYSTEVVSVIATKQGLYENRPTLIHLLRDEDFFCHREVIFKNIVRLSLQVIDDTTINTTKYNTLDEHAYFLKDDTFIKVKEYLSKLIEDNQLEIILNRLKT